MPRDATIELLNAAVDSDDCGALSRHSFAILDGPIDVVMGGSAEGYYDFGPWWAEHASFNHIGHEHPQDQHPLHHLRMWLTEVTNHSVYQGWHDWHQDGPAAYGRLHKAFIMVHKD